jgi:hypothetical protein
MKLLTHATNLLAASAGILLRAPSAHAGTVPAIPALSAYVIADDANPNDIGISVNMPVYPGNGGLASCANTGCVNVPSLPIAQTGAYTSSPPASPLSVSDTAGVTVGTAPGGAVDPSVAVTLAASGSASVSAQAWLTYFFTVIGPGSSVQIQLQGSNTTKGSFQVPPPYVASVETTTSVMVFAGMASGNPLTTEDSNGSFSTALTLTPGAIYGVTISALVAASLNPLSVDTALAAASVDPFLTAPSGYTIDYSAGLTATTPLPATWIMIVSGLGLMGFVARRGEKKATKVRAVA